MKLFRKWLEILYKSTHRQQEFLPATFAHLCLHTEIARSSWSALRALIRLNGLSDDGSVSDRGSPHQAWPRAVLWSPGTCLLLCTLSPTWSLGLLCSLARVHLGPSWWVPALWLCCPWETSCVSAGLCCSPPVTQSNHTQVSKTEII